MTWENSIRTGRIEAGDRVQVAYRARRGGCSSVGKVLVTDGVRAVVRLNSGEELDCNLGQITYHPHPLTVRARARRIQRGWSKVEAESRLSGSCRAQPAELRQVAMSDLVSSLRRR